MNKQKGLAPILIVLLIAIVLGGYLIYQKQIKPVAIPQQTSESTPVPTSISESTTSAETANPDSIGANWKTYTNTKYNLSIKYPNSVTVEEKEIAGNPQQIYNKSHIYFNIEGGVLEIYGVCGRGIQPIRKYDLVVGGQKTTKFYETATSGAIAAIPRPNSNEYICFNFKLPVDSSKTQNIDNLFDQILSTFKFLDQAENPEGKFCGGLAANLPENQCPKGYTCQMDGNYPDAGGKCVKK